MSKTLIIDIETVPQYPSYGDMGAKDQQLFTEKEQYKLQEHTPEEWYERKGGILAEFGKIIVIGLGLLIEGEEGRKLHIASLASDQEKELLEEFLHVMEKKEMKHFILCGHNVREFDIPYLCRRLLVHSLPIPTSMNWQSKKPWEVKNACIDTMELWKFGDYKHFTSLNLLCHCLQIPSSKEDMSGGEVKAFFYEKNDLDSIKKYCERDVVATAQVYLRLTGKELIQENNISFKNIYAE